jgi:hypothetical protein
MSMPAPGIDSSNPSSCVMVRLLAPALRYRLPLNKKYVLFKLALGLKLLDVLKNAGLLR